MKATYDIAVIGGGAAGLAAAITAGRKGKTVLIIEKEQRLGKKLLATGNGRCNFTNLRSEISRYHGKEPAFAAPAMAQFPPESNIAFFRSLGVMAKTEEDAKVYPLSLQAAAVLDMLRLELERLAIDVVNDCRIQKICPQNRGFQLIGEKERFHAEKVIAACGGMASPELGGCGYGYDLLKELGHTLTPIAPALVKIKTENRLPNALKGIKIEGTLTLKRKGRPLGREAGEILFTDFGISGPPVLQLSRLLCFAPAEEFTAELDLLPDFSKEEVITLLQERRKLLGTATLEHFLTGLIQKKAGMLLTKEALNTKLSRTAKELDDGELQKLAAMLKGFSLPVKGVLGWKQAQVTAGGIDTAGFDPATMESRLVPGLFAVGEVLDIDGDCGGFNLQWAWASGRLAGTIAAKDREERQ